MTKPIYMWKDDKEKREFDSEAAVKEAFPAACDPSKHDWKSTFAFGTYDCWNCQIRKK